MISGSQNPMISGLPHNFLEIWRESLHTLVYMECCKYTQENKKLPFSYMVSEHRSLCSDGLSIFIF